MDISLNPEAGAEPRPGTEPRSGRLPVDVVQHIHRLVGGDARTEKMVEDYIKFRWKAPNLFYIPPKAASEIIRRPADFLTAAKQHSEPELKF